MHDPQQVRNLLTMYYKLELTMYYRLELTMYYYCFWYDKLWGPSQRVVTLLNGMLALYLALCTQSLPLKTVPLVALFIYIWTRGVNGRAHSQNRRRK